MFTIKRVSSVESTQTYCKSLIDSKIATHGDVVRADKQTNGYGRLGRTWQGSEGNLYCSIILSPKTPLNLWYQLSLVTGVASAETCKRLNCKTTLKWPNDLMFHGQKCAGILVEVYGDYAVIGMGVNTQTAPDDTACLKCDTNVFFDEFLHNFKTYYQHWEQERWSHILQAWQTYSFPIGHTFQTTINGEKQYVRYNGLTDDGFLRYKDAHGQEHIERNAS